MVQLLKLQHGERGQQFRDVRNVFTEIDQLMCNILMLEVESGRR